MTRHLARKLLAGAISLVATTQLFKVAAAEDSRMVVARPMIDLNSRFILNDSAAQEVQSGSEVRLTLARFDRAAIDSFTGTSLTIVSADGRRSRFQADSQGVVRFKAPTPGIYGLITSGTAGHMAIPLIVRERGKDVGPSSRRSNVLLPTFGVDPSEPIRAFNSFLPPGSSTMSLSDLDSDLINTGRVIPTYRYRVFLDSQGRMRGQVLSLMRSEWVLPTIARSNILIFKEGKLLARAITDDVGRFEVENLAPGNYGLISAGAGGYAAFAFEALARNEIASHSGPETFVSTFQVASSDELIAQIGSGDILPVVPIPQPLIPELATILRDEEETPLIEEISPSMSPIPGAGGGFAGGGPGGGLGGGGGGFGGGGGGFGGGGLLGLAGLGAAVAAAASGSSGDRVITTPTASPASP